MKGYRRLLIVLIAMLAVLVACAPKPVPAPPQAVSGRTTPASPTLGSQDAAWAKVVEAAKKEGKVLAYSSLLMGDTFTAVSKAFNEKYGITLEVVAGVSTLNSERIRTEYMAKKYVSDIWDASQTIALLLKKDGLLQPAGELPALTNKDVYFFPPRYDSEGVLLSWGKYWVVPYVNTDMVKPQDEPGSYLDFLQPQWKGKALITDPSIPMLAVTYASLKYHKVLDVDDYFRRLGQQQPMITPNIQDHAAKVARGEVPLAISGHERFFNPYIKKGAPLKPLYMKEGVPLRNQYVWSLLREAPHPNAARLFVNWLFSPEGQTVANEATAGSPNRKDAADFSAVSKIISPQAKTFFVQNEWIDEEASRVVNEGVLQNLLGLRK